MARVITLGTAAAIPDEAHANTHLAIEGEQGFILVDCSDSHPLLRLQRVGLAPERLRGLIITHFHPDHIAGIPGLLMHTWLLGRTAPLPVYGSSDILERFKTLMGLFYWDEWPAFYPVSYHPVAADIGALVLEDDEFRITSASVQHVVPTIGLRIENKRTGRVVAYSCDTAPCEAMVALAQGADVLIHEAARNTPGHSSAAQAGEVARQVGAGRLVLIHYRPVPEKYDRWIAEATEAFGGPVELAQDLGEYVF